MAKCGNCSVAMHANAITALLIVVIGWESSSSLLFAMFVTNKEVGRRLTGANGYYETHQSWRNAENPQHVHTLNRRYIFNTQVLQGWMSWQSRITTITLPKHSHVPNAEAVVCVSPGCGGRRRLSMQCQTKIYSAPQLWCALSLGMSAGSKTNPKRFPRPQRYQIALVHMSTILASEQLYFALWAFCTSNFPAI